MSALALYHPGGSDVRRYGGAATAIVLVHAAVISAALFVYRRPEPVGFSLQPILVELAPAPGGQRIETASQAPGPIPQVAEAPPPEPQKIEKVEELPPTPRQPQSVVTAPPKLERMSEPVPSKPTPVQDRRPVKKQLVEQKTAARAERVARDTPTSGSVASAGAAASYRAMLFSHLVRFKQQPTGPGDHSGSPVVSLTVARDGRITGSRLMQSSGSAAVDQAALATMRAASPAPAFLPEMREVSITYTAPFYYGSRAR